MSPDLQRSFLYIFSGQNVQSPDGDMLEADDERRERLHARLVEELQRNIVPVVKDRSFPREKQTKANKFSMTKRQGL